MRVSECHALGCELIEAGCFDFTSSWIQALHIAIAKIVGEDIDDVGIGAFCLVSFSREGKQTNESE